jgi:small-conductance mechanosensitive channel
MDSVAKSLPMDKKAAKYLAVETVGSAVVNGILNFAGAFAIFHGRSLVATGGPAGLSRDLIGETFLVAALSVLVPSLIARRRRRAGTLPITTGRRPKPAGNLYLRAIIAGLILTCVLAPCNAWLLPGIFPGGVSFRNVLLFKTLYGTILGAIATFLAVRRSLNEAD